MHFAMIAMGLVVAVICLVIAQQIMTTALGNGTNSSFTGLSYTVASNVIPIAIVGLLVFVAYASMGQK
jgi:hypothetical protein